MWGTGNGRHGGGVGGHLDERTSCSSRTSASDLFTSINAAHIDLLIVYPYLVSQSQHPLYKSYFLVDGCAGLWMVLGGTKTISFAAIATSHMIDSILLTFPNREN